jgi:molybdopterin-guanine dinucleotide biosynthesis protein A
MITGVVLAGGLSRRMGGQPKGLLTLSGEVMVTRIIRRMHPICNELLVVANEPELYREHLPENVDIISDLSKDAGPLGGMDAAFKHASHSVLWIMGCDMPFVSHLAAGFMYDQLIQNEELAAAIPEIGGKLHPLHGIYRKSATLQVEQLLLQQHYRVTGLLDHIRWVKVEEQSFLEASIPTNFTINANTPAEWQQVQAEELRISSENKRKE